VSKFVSSAAERHLERRKKLLAAIEPHAPAILVTNTINVTYLTGFTGSSSCLYLSENETVLITDSRYTIQVSEECGEIQMVLRQNTEKMAEAVARSLGSAMSGKVAIEADSVTLNAAEQIKTALPNVELCPTAGLISSIREIKDEFEISEIRRSIEMAENAFETVKNMLTANHTELQVAAELEYQIRQQGGVGCAFTPIVGVGKRAALPHAVLTDQPMSAAEFVLIDWGAQAGLYKSDLTRVLATAKISPKLERIYGVVLTAQQRAIDAIRPGAIMKDVDAAARDYIREEGHGDDFGHGLGHGFGLEIHESVRLSATENRELKPGMVVTVEPGIYLSDWGGVRIEDDVLVTPNGCEVLTNITRNLAECVVNL